MKIPQTFCLTLVIALGMAAAVQSRPNKERSSPLRIALDPATRLVRVQWEGRGVLRKISLASGSHRKVAGRPGRRVNALLMPATGPGNLFVLEEKGAGGAVVSQNIVGYASLEMPPGLSLLANPLYYSNNALSFWMPQAPDGSQVYKLTAEGGYEVSTFDALTGGWSNPLLQLPIGEGFHFYNPSGEILYLTFVGEVRQGELINPLPAGVSMKGSLVPQEGSIQSLHNIPGEPGDELRVYINDRQGGGSFQSSFYVQGQGWFPDLRLGVGQGFYMLKQHQQDWIRIFSAF